MVDKADARPAELLVSLPEPATFWYAAARARKHYRKVAWPGHEATGLPKAEAWSGLETMYM